MTTPTEIPHDPDARDPVDDGVTLLPCPFCGCRDLVLTNEADLYGRGTREMVACGGCGTQAYRMRIKQLQSALIREAAEIARLLHHADVTDSLDRSMYGIIQRLRAAGTDGE